MLRLPDRAQALQYGRSVPLGGLSALVQRPSRSAGSCSRKTAVVQAGVGLPSPFGDAGASASNSWTVPTSVLGRVAPGEAVRFCLSGAAAACCCSVVLVAARFCDARYSNQRCRRQRRARRSCDIIICLIFQSLSASCSGRGRQQRKTPPTTPAPATPTDPPPPSPPNTPHTPRTGLGRRPADRLHRAPHHQL
jgi:hypothetical protein